MKHFVKKKIIIINISISIILLNYFPAFSTEKIQRRYPCDPKFGYEGNYIEIMTGSVASARNVMVCFGNENYRVDQLIEKKMDKKNESENCIELAKLPGRFKKNSAKWTQWKKNIILNSENTLYQFALCGSKNEHNIWENFHRYHDVTSWDEMKIEVKNSDKLWIRKLRVVQNRVRILDNEKAEEGYVDSLLISNSGGTSSIKLAERIKTTKLNRIKCLNVLPGDPYCEASIPGLEREINISPVIITSLLELGHSGSIKYNRKNNAYCSEFAFYVIEKAVSLSKICNKKIPNPIKEDIDVFDMFKWFNKCDRIIKKDNIRNKIKPGDFISTGNMGHSSIFLGWADPKKINFWEISGNNHCLPERETFYAPKYMGNMVCISKKDFDKYVLSRDFGGQVGD